MATRQQIEEAIRRADKAGDADAVRKLGAHLKSLDRPAAKPAPKKKPSLWDIPNKIVSAANEAAIGFGEGIYNVGSAVTDPIMERALNVINGEGSGTRARNQANRNRKGLVDRVASTLVSDPDKASREVGRFAGSLVVPLPGKKLQQGGKVARAGYRALQGAVGGAAMRDVDQDPTANAAIGAAANVVLPPVISAVAKPVAALAGKAFGRGLAAPVDDMAALGSEAAERTANFEAVGVKNPTTGMVTRNPTAFEFERTHSKGSAGESLLEQIHGIEQTLIGEGSKLVQRRGGAKGAEATGLSAQKVLEAKQNEMREITNKLYTEVRDTRGDEIVGDLPFLRERMDDPDILDNAMFDSMRESLIRRMNTLGILKNGKPGKTKIDISQAEELRKFIGQLGSSSEPAVRKLRHELIDAIDEDVVEAIGDDAFKAARASAKARFTEFQKTYAGRIVDEKIPPEKVTKHILGASSSLDDVRSLKRTLLTGSREQKLRGREALNQLRSQAMDDLLSGAISSEGRLAGRQLVKGFTQQRAKLQELLPPADFKQLEKLVVASRDATVPPEGAPGTAGITALFQSLPPKIQDGWMKFMLKSSAAHSAAFMTGGPAANVALGVAQQTAGSGLQRTAANAFIKRIQMAQDPKAAAAAVAAAERAARSNPILRELLDNNVVGGAAVAIGDN